MNTAEAALSGFYVGNIEKHILCLKDKVILGSLPKALRTLSKFTQKLHIMRSLRSNL